MEISETKIKLVENRSDRLKAFCLVTFDNAFVIRDLKIIEGTDGYFVAMPSRKLTDRCRSCGYKNHLRARFCNECGSRLDDNRGTRGPDGRTKMHADVAHPINAESRAALQSRVVEAYEREIELAESPDYKPTKLGDDYDDDDGHHPRRPPSPTSDAPASAAAPEAPAASEPVSEEPQSEPEENRSSGFGDGLV